MTPPSRPPLSSARLAKLAQTKPAARPSQRRSSPLPAQGQGKTTPPRDARPPTTKPDPAPPPEIRYKAPVSQPKPLSRPQTLPRCQTPPASAALGIGTLPPRESTDSVLRSAPPTPRQSSRTPLTLALNTPAGGRLNHSRPFRATAPAPPAQTAPRWRCGGWAGTA